MMCASGTKKTRRQAAQNNPRRPALMRLQRTDGRIGIAVDFQAGWNFTPKFKLAAVGSLCTQTEACNA